MPHTTGADTTAEPAQPTPSDALFGPDARSSSPVAPAYSPITPKVQPAFPVHTQGALVSPQHTADFTFPPREPAHFAGSPGRSDGRTAEPPTQHIPQPPSRPFSGEDATDAIALRAAISTLQFQKKKAQDDIKALEDIKQLAMNDPDQFRSELVAGRLNEHKPRQGDFQAILAEESNTDSDTAHSRPSSEHRSSADDVSMSSKDRPNQFPAIPGPQSVVRMPHVNWEKYDVAGESLENIHRQQQRWPGSSPHTQAKGRQHEVAAPYSPWLDSEIENQHEQREERRDSAAVAASSTPAASATGTVSEHPVSRP